MKLQESNYQFLNWYPLIEKYTPKSTYYPLSKEDFLIIHAAAYDHVLTYDPYMSEIKYRPNTQKTKDEEQIHLDKIAKLLDKDLKNGPKFFRTSIFSPKDVGTCIVSNGKEAIEMLIKSARFFYKTPMIMVDYKIGLVLRDVVNYVEEYRTFVKDGIVLGVSQGIDSNIINYQLTLDEDKKYFVDDVKIKQVKTFVEEVSSNSGITEAVFDVGITDNGDFLIVECNPFSNKTDKCLLAKYDIYGEFPHNFVSAYQINSNGVLVKEFNNGECNSHTVPLKYDSKNEYYAANRKSSFGNPILQRIAKSSIERKLSNIEVNDEEF